MKNSDSHQQATNMEVGEIEVGALWNISIPHLKQGTNRTNWCELNFHLEMNPHSILPVAATG